ncbi:hypothetical protein EDD85DRAFT_798341 [Armillaria nabsnona]|nr:hypothetical protein EDD85DRAFT_798341 [Armillaria nabsnona]
MPDPPADQNLDSISISERLFFIRIVEVALQLTLLYISSPLLFTDHKTLSTERTQPDRETVFFQKNKNLLNTVIGAFSTASFLNVNAPNYISVSTIYSIPRPESTSTDPDSEALTESDFRDPSGKLSDLSLGHCFQYAQPSGAGGRIAIAYPNKTAGFYYYWTHPDLPATADQLRFRITPTNDPLLFEPGSDLLRLNGIPWLVSVRKLLSLPNTSYLQKLLKDGLVTKDMISSEYLRTYRKLQLRSSALLESYYNVFPWSLPRSSVTINMMSSTNEVARMNVELGDHSWVEGLQLIEPGKKGQSIKSV